MSTKTGFIERPSGNTESPEILLLLKYGLVRGSSAAFEKVALRSPSSVPIGSITEGVVQNEVRLGEPILFDNGAVISDIMRIEEHEGTLLVHTSTSTYRLRRETPHRDAENFELEDVAMVETEKGSVYRYLPNGTTQRFKKAEGKEYDPQSALVYVPDYAWVKQHASPKWLAKLGENETIYTQVLLDYVQNPRGIGKEANKKSYIVDQSGKIVETNQEIKNTKGPIYLNLLTDGKLDLSIPLSRRPKVGFMTFDTRRYKDEETGEDMRERHLGNKVVKIILKKK